MENDIPTAEEWLTSFGADADDMFYKHSVEEAMIEFARLHVGAALKAASEETKMLDDKECWRNCSCQQPCKIIDKNSILNAYPLTNIK